MTASDVGTVLTSSCDCGCRLRIEQSCPHGARISTAAHGGTCSRAPKRAVSGEASCRLAGEHADAMIAVEPKAELGELFDAAGGAGKPLIGQTGLSFDRDEQTARKRAHDQFRWFLGGWHVMAELPGPTAFDSASTTVTEDDIVEQLPCGPDTGAHVAAVKKFVEAGFTHVAVVQIGGDAQDVFFDWAASDLLPELRKL